MSNSAQKQNSVREILAHQLMLRQESNSSYTLRSFARDLDISPSQISRVLTQRAGLSRLSAEKISKKLRFTPEATRRFLHLVDLEYSRSGSERRRAKEALLQETHAFSDLDRKVFNAMDEWYYRPFLCLTEMDDFREDSAWIACKLGIEEPRVQPMIDQLFELKLLHRVDGRMLPTGGYFSNSNGLPSKSIRKYHRQIMEKAIDAIEGQNTHERYLSTLMLAVDENQMSEAQLYIRQFLDEFKKKFTHELNKKNQVYCLSLQYFGITRDDPEDQG